jgi:hypothetical protein
MSSIYETFSTSVSFIHLNIQSLVPKLDLIYAEYEHFDIMSFTENLVLTTFAVQIIRKIYA